MEEALYATDNKLIKGKTKEKYVKVLGYGGRGTKDCAHIYTDKRKYRYPSEFCCDTLDKWLDQLMKTKSYVRIIVDKKKRIHSFCDLVKIPWLLLNKENASYIEAYNDFYIKKLPK